MKDAYFAASCFWNIQKTFDEISQGKIGYSEAI
jgi:peptide methionine sulfoxide reductase MsrA